MPASARRASTPCSIRPLGRPRRKGTARGTNVDIDRLRVGRTGVPQVTRRRPKSTTPAWGAGVGDDSRLYTPPAIPRGPSDRGDAGAKKYASLTVIYRSAETAS